MNVSSQTEYQKVLRLYEQLIANHPMIERKGKTMPYTSCNGHMFSFLSKEGVVCFRLPKADREVFIEEFNSRLAVQYGRVMKEYVEVPINFLKERQKATYYLQKSYDYVASLKPKSAQQ